MSEPTLEEFGLDVTVYRELQGLERLRFWLLLLIYFCSCSAILFFFNFDALFKNPFSSLFFSVIAALVLTVISIEWLPINYKKKIDLLKQKIAPFEEKFCLFYENEIDTIFNSQLYRKRSGNSQFTAALLGFSSLLDAMSQANDTLVTRKFHLETYKQYLRRRLVNNTSQINRESSHNFVALNNFINKTSQRSIKPMPVAPEEAYRMPRKIDWETINKNRGKIGVKGEEIAVEIEQKYLKSIDKGDLADKIRHVSVEDGDGLGYDILSFFPDGREKFIEVKSTTQSIGSPFYISRNELGFLQKHQHDAFIYRVRISLEDSDVSLLIKSGDDILQENELIPIQYMVKTK